MPKFRYGVLTEIQMRFLKQLGIMAVGLFLLAQLSAEEGHDPAKPRPIEELKQKGTLPKPVKMMPPQYPYEMSKKGISGSVLVEFIIDTKGNVPQSRVIKSTNPGFEMAALTAVNKWKFIPGEMNGLKVNTLVSQILDFNLEEKK